MDALPKRISGKLRRHRTNWGICDAQGRWAFVDGSPACFDTKVAAKAWIEMAAVTPDWVEVSDAQWLGGEVNS